MRMPHVWLFALLAAAVLPGCSREAGDKVAFRPAATLQEIMVSIIDPNVDYVWNAVSTVSTAQGTEERKPQTDAEWKILSQRALTLAEAANLLLIPGRQVAAQGLATSSGGAELGPEAIRKAIDGNPAEFARLALGLQDAAKLLLIAIDRKNADELVEAGGKVEQACEQCHSQFWYPGDKRPK